MYFVLNMAVVMRITNHVAGEVQGISRNTTRTLRNHRIENNHMINDTITPSTPQYTARDT